MSSSNFDLNLFLRSFTEAGATVFQTSEKGKIIVNGIERTGYSVLNSFFDGNYEKPEMSLMIEGKAQTQRTDFPSIESALLAA